MAPYKTGKEISHTTV